jgi:hypothetical protein
MENAHAKKTYFISVIKNVKLLRIVLEIVAKKLAIMEIVFAIRVIVREHVDLNFQQEIVARNVNIKLKNHMNIMNVVLHIYVIIIVIIVVTNARNFIPIMIMSIFV